jgi:DNA polymerase beta
MNSELIGALVKLRDIAGIFGQVYNEKAYRKAILEISKIDFKIDKSNVVNFLQTRIPGVGKNISQKILEYITTGSIAELNDLLSSNKLATYKSLAGIIGVGPVTIERWIGLNINSLHGLRVAVGKGIITLNNMQKYGLRHYNDLNKRIPRDEVTKICSVIRDNLMKMDRDLVFDVAGSYRRGLQTSGDIDIIISNKDRFRTNLLARFIEDMHDDIYFVAVLSAGPERTSFLYKSPISSIVRQIDILNIKYSSYHAALLYFTGDADFNENMRGYAKKNGFRLNQAGLFKVSGERLKLVRVGSEEEIFEVLNLRYIRPSDRTGLVTL